MRIQLNIIFAFCFLLFCNYFIAQSSEITATEQAEEILKTNDFNSDNKLSKSEVDLSFKLRRFNKVDLNSDEFLDKEELIQSYQRAIDARNQNSQQMNTSTLNKIFSNNSLKDSGQKYTVETGDSLYSVSKKYNVSVENLMKFNRIEDETRLPIGIILKIPQAQ